jgi:hypothetical protein
MFDVSGKVPGSELGHDTKYPDCRGFQGRGIKLINQKTLLFVKKTNIRTSQVSRTQQTSEKGKKKRRR